MIKAVFFDFYKTLFAYKEQSFERSLRKIAARYGVKINCERYEAAGASLFTDTSASSPANHSLLEWLTTVIARECEFVRELGVQEHAEQMAWELLQSGHPFFGVTNATLHDDVVPILEHLRDAGFRLPIVSNWDTPLDPLTERLGIAEYFDAIVASHDARVRSEKPDPYIFNHALAAVGVSAEEVVHVGDTYKADIVGAQGVGIRPILLDRDRTQTGRREETIRSLNELPELLKGQKH